MIFWRMLVTKQLLVAIDFHSMEKNTIEVSGYQQLFGYILQNIFSFHFWINFPFEVNV